MWTLAIVVMLACGGSDAPAAAAAPPAQPTAVKVITVATSAATDTVEATGIVEVIDTVVVQPETAGIVSAVLFEDGQTVAKGTALVRLRDAEAKAEVAEAEARLNLAELSLERVSALRPTEQVAQAEVDRARAERDLARAQLDRAREGLRRTTIVAPFSGVAGRREVAVGQVVTPLTVITRVDDLDPVTVDVALPEAVLARVTTGQASEVSVAAFPGRTFTGTLAYVAPRASATGRSLDARVHVPNPDGALRPGLTADVAITTGEVPDAVLVPTYAVVQTAGGASAWVVDAEGKAQPRALTLGRRGPETIRVLEGIAAGDTLIVEGYARLRPGAPVEIQAAGAGGGAAPADGGAAPAGGGAAPAKAP